jgi:hypothetical protein
MDKEKHNEFIILGSYTEKQAEILRIELEKNDISVQIFFPEKSEARPEWLAQTFMIPQDKVREAIAICKALKLPYDAKMPESGREKIFNWIIFLLILGAIFAVGYFLYSLKY